MVPTVDGTTITVKCGDPSWPNMNGDNEPAQVYTVNVKVKSDDKPVTPTNTKVLVRAQDGGAWLHQPMVRELTGGEAENTATPTRWRAFPLWMRWWSPTS